MGIRELVLKNRSYRRFYEDVKIDRKTLEELVDLARHSPSAKNLQHFKYHLACTPEICEQIFPCTAWAGLLKDWKGPESGERPAAYITMLHDTSISPNTWHDQGFSAQSILLGAVEKGLGGCVIAALNKPRLKEILQLPDHLDIVFTIALGKPKEIIVIDEPGEDGNTAYWRDQNQVHHVPKRSLRDLIIN